MRGQFALALAVACLFAPPAFAQSSTATGVGVGVANSSSRSNSVAIGGGNASGNGGTASSAVTVNGNPAVTSASINENQNVSGTQTLRNVPAVFAPGLTAAGLETCLGSVSGGASVVGFGATFGSTIPDPGCAARLDARTLWSMGLKRAAIARLCLMDEIRRSMPEVCSRYLPQVGPDGRLYAQAPESAQTPVAYNGGPVEVIDKKTGLHRMCADFDMTRRRCRGWAHVQTAAAN